MSDLKFTLTENDLTKTEVVLAISKDGELVSMERDHAKWPSEWRPLLSLLTKLLPAAHAERTAP